MSFQTEGRAGQLERLVLVRRVRRRGDLPERDDRRDPKYHLPDVVAALKGPPSLPVQVAVIGHTDSVRSRLANGDRVFLLRSTFDSVPDAPVSEFTLELQGGSKGLFVNSQNLCEGRRRHFTAAFTGQNGKTATLRPALAVSCHGKRHKRRQGRR